MQPDGLETPSAKRIKLDSDSSVIKQEKEENIDSGTCGASTSTPKHPSNNQILTETEAALSRLGSDILVTPKAEVKYESKFTPKVTPNGSHLNLLNHSTYFNMTMSPLVLNGSSITITPKDVSFGQNMNHEKSEKPWFSIVARDEINCHFSPNDASLEKGIALIRITKGSLKKRECLKKFALFAFPPHNKDITNFLTPSLSPKIKTGHNNVWGFQKPNLRGWGS